MSSNVMRDSFQSTGNCQEKHRIVCDLQNLPLTISHVLFLLTGPCGLCKVLLDVVLQNVLQWTLHPPQTTQKHAPFSHDIFRGPEGCMETLLSCTIFRRSVVSTSEYAPFSCGLLASKNQMRMGYAFQE